MELTKNEPEAGDSLSSDVEFALGHQLDPDCLEETGYIYTDSESGLVIGVFTRVHQEVEATSVAAVLNEETLARFQRAKSWQDSSHLVLRIMSRISYSHLLDRIPELAELRTQDAVAAWKRHPADLPSLYNHS